MERVENERQLKNYLVNGILISGKDNLLLSTGHFPLIYRDVELADEALRFWGAFTIQSLEIAIDLAFGARSVGKNVKFVFFVDDHSYENWDLPGGSSRIKGARRRLYQLRSGPDAKLNEEFKVALRSGRFDENDVLRHDHGKKGREDCLYFSEKVLRATDRDIKNPCAREYVTFLEDPKYFDKKTTHLVSFIPQRCKKNICSHALPLIGGLSASHVFMPIGALDWSQSYTLGPGINYRRDLPIKVQ